MSPSLLEVAEAPAAHITPRHPRVVVGDGYVLSQMGPHDGAVQAIRIESDRLDEVQASVRALARERGWTSIAWWTSELTRPAGLGEQLGLEQGETLSALALTRPPQGASSLTVRRVQTVEDFATAQQIDLVAQGIAGGDEPRDPAADVAAWEGLREIFMLWLALDGDRPVGMARAAAADGALMLIGGATLPEARGRGVYRALVEARWQTAIARGTPALVVAANHQSGPILERLGFERLGEIQQYVDAI